MQMLHLQVISPGAERNRLFNCFEYLDRPALYSLSKALSGTLFWKPINSSAATFQQCTVPTECGQNIFLLSIGLL